MKALPTLIRLARQAVDEARLELADIERARDEIVRRIGAHDDALAAEQRAAMSSYESGRAYGGYAIAALAQRRALVAQADALAAQADGVRVRLGAAHVELKKVERLLELQEERAARETRRREEAMLDEAATLRAGRRR